MEHEVVMELVERDIFQIRTDQEEFNDKFEGYSNYEGSTKF